MPLRDTLKLLDQFKVNGTFMIPKIQRNGKKNYSISFGSLPGFFLTVIAASCALIFLVPQTLNMLAGNMDIFKSEMFYSNSPSPVLFYGEGNKFGI